MYTLDFNPHCPSSLDYRACRGPPGKWWDTQSPFSNKQTNTKSFSPSSPIHPKLSSSTSLFKSESQTCSTALKHWPFGGVSHVPFLDGLFGESGQCPRQKHVRAFAIMKTYRFRRSADYTVVSFLLNLGHKVYFPLLVGNI